MGFDVLNQSRLAQSKPQRTPTKVVTAAVAIYSPPRARHESKMEQAVLSMTTADLGCSARQIARNGNGTDSGEMCRHVAKLNRGRFEQAKAAAPESNALHLP